LPTLFRWQLIKYLSKVKKVVFALLCFLNLTVVLAQGKVDKSKKALTESEGVNYQKSHAAPAQNSSGDSGGNSLLGDIIVGVFTYTVGAVGKYALIGDYKYEDHLHNDLTYYPYHKPEAGNFYTPEADEASVYKFRVDLEDKFLYSNNDLFANHLEVKVRPLAALYLKTDYYRIFELNEIAGTRDQLSLWYFNFAYDRIRFERFNLGWTLGASYVAGEVDRGGFSFGLNADYFLKKNISFTAGAKWSHINGEPVHDYEFESKFHRRQYYFGVGFEQLKIAKPVYNFVTVGGGLYF